MSNTERKPRNTNYQTFYKDAIDKKKGYVTKDGTWAAVPILGSRQFAIIHNGERVHTSRNFDFAKSYILKEKRKHK